MLRGILDDLLRLVWLMLPAYGANMAPPLLRFWHGWNRPICERWLGTHKTMLGFALGVAAGVSIAWLQHVIHPSLADDGRWLLLGFAFGAGAMLGDAAKSFVKRRLSIAPGSRWLPFDQIDFVLGALLAISPWIVLPLREVIAILALTFVGDLVVNQLAFRLGIKRTPW